MPAKYRKTSQSKVELYDRKSLLYRKLRKINRSSSRLCRRILSSFRMYRPTQDHDDEGDRLLPVSITEIPSATMLWKAGIKFKEKEGDSFLDVEFRDGVMAIPVLRVYDFSSSLFRNLLAFEQRFPSAGSYFSSYMLLMDSLICNDNDVALLHRYGCIRNYLDKHHNIVLLLDSISKNVVVELSSCYLTGMKKDLMQHYGSRWRKWRAKLMHDCLSSPSAFLSLAGSLVIYGAKINFDLGGRLYGVEQSQS